MVQRAQEPPQSLKGKMFNGKQPTARVAQGETETMGDRKGDRNELEAGGNRGENRIGIRGDDEEETLP